MSALSSIGISVGRTHHPFNKYPTQEYAGICGMHLDTLCREHCVLHSQHAQWNASKGHSSRKRGLPHRLPLVAAPDSPPGRSGLIAPAPKVAFRVGWLSCFLSCSVAIEDSCADRLKKDLLLSSGYPFVIRPCKLLLLLWWCAC